MSAPTPMQNSEITAPIVISVVVPVYGCQQCLHELCNRLITSLSKITADFEILLINDRCPQNSWATIVKICAADRRIKGINLSRNFGQHHAITAGLDFTRGKWVVVMDCDLQDQPEEIYKLYNKANEGFDVVLGRRSERKDSPLRKALSKTFHSIFSYFTNQQTNPSIANFGIFSEKVVINFRKMKEHNRTFLLFVYWLGFNITEIDLEHSERAFGKSSYTFSKMFNLAIDSIVTHSNKPLKLGIAFGFFMSFLSMFFAAAIVVRYLVWSIPVQGWASIIVSMYFLAGMLLGSIGILGLYIGKIFDEVKNRPLYVIDTAINLDSTNLPGNP